MKRFLLSLTALLFASAFLMAEVTEKTYHFSEPAVAEADGYHLISFENTMLNGVAGEPALPYQAVALLLPPGHEARSIRVIPGGEVVLEGTYQIHPRQHAQPVSKGRSGEFIKNEAVYQQDAAYPANLCGQLTTQFQNGYSVAMTAFTPVQYNPATGQLSYFKSVTVEVVSAAGGRAEGALQNLQDSETVMQRLEHLVQNISVAESYPRPQQRSDDYDMIIITPDQFAGDFEQLVDFYAPRGLEVQIATTEDIYASMTGQDNQEKIRNYIIQEYQDHGIQHVTLAGDVEHVPYRGFYCTVQSSSVYESNDIPSDLYYSGLDGTWNDDGDENWAEIGEDDLLPEVGIGRFSISNQSDLDALMNKTLSYQESPVLGELRDELLVGEWLYGSPETWGADYLELLIGYQNENGYETTGIPEDHNITTMYERDQSWSSGTLMQEMNQGHSFIHHVGHANSNYTMKFYNSDITNSNFSQLNGTTHNYTLILSHGCICGAIDDNDCIAERMINIDNLAVAVLMNSRYGWFNEGQTEGPAAHLNREFVDAIYDKKEGRIGMAYTLTRIETAPWVTAPGQWEEGALRWNFYCLNVLGEGALNIWTDEPVDITAQYQDALPVGVPSIQVSISGNGPVENLSCVFIKDGVTHGKAQTDESGQAEIVFDEPITELGEATIYVSGYNCLMEEFPVTVTDNSQTFEPVWATPFNPMTFYITGATIDGADLTAGSQIGIFDTDPNTGEAICVGAAEVEAAITPEDFLEMIASMDDGSLPGQANGFTPGHAFMFRVINPSNELIDQVAFTFPYSGYDEVFTAQGTAIVELAGTTQAPQQHTIDLPAGWSSLSSYLTPQNTSIGEVLSSIDGQYGIIQNLDNYYQPEAGAGGLNTWDYHSGYFIKTNQVAQLDITGFDPADKTIELTEGWNLVPVLSDTPVEIETLFQGHLDQIVIIKNALELQLFWPAAGVETLQYMQPGKAYLIKTNTAFSFGY